MTIPPTSLRRQHGFTLFELLVAALVVAAIGGAVAAAFPMLGMVSQVEYELRQKSINMNLAAAFEDWMGKHGITSTGLPAPFSGTAGGLSYQSAPLNPDASSGSDTQLLELIRRRGIEPADILSDAPLGGRQRVYQVVSNNLTETTQLYGATGPRIQLSYSIGVIYTSDCAIPCSASLPGSSPALTAANRTTWDTAGDDLAPAYISTLHIERAKLQLFNERLRILISRFTHHVNDKITGSTPPDYRTNHFPPNGPSTVGSNNQMGCNGYWVPLGASQLNALGLPVDEFSTTPWNAPIHYCRDYAPDGSPADVPPHFGALRFHASLGAGSFPAAALSNVCSGGATNNCSVILTL